jgi:hypothetical protein
MSEFIIAKKLLEDMTGLVFKSKELTTIDFKINFDVFIINITIYFGCLSSINTCIKKTSRLQTR